MTVKTMISRILRFFKTAIWETRLKDIPRGKAFFVRCLRIILLARQEFNKDGCAKDASALTYYSLLNVVPVFAVAFAIAKGFGLEKLIKNQILQMAEKGNWQTDVTNQIITFSGSLLEQTKGGIIAGVGVILLLWTVISILGKIEEAFNNIWEVKKSRTLIRKFSDYMTMMVLAPVLFVISSSITVVVASKVKFIVQQIALLGIFSQVIFFFLSLLPYVSMWVLLTLVYVMMPNTKIPLRSGILAGIAAGTIYQVIQTIYIKFQIGAASYGAIYGSLAALPLLLVWLQLSWMILLFGAEIAFANEHYETFGFQPDYSRLSISSKKLLVLKIFHLLVKKFSKGEKPFSAAQIAYALEIPVRLVRHLLYELTNVGLVVEIATGTKSEVAFQPGKTIENITFKYALDEYEKNGITQIPQNQLDEAEKISVLLKSISDTIEKSPGNVNLKEI
jgi:membrane protein